MITEELIDLKQEFERIKNIGYVKVKRGALDIRKVFEELLEKKYLNTEIKINHDYSNSYLPLLGMIPRGKNAYEVNRLRCTYGYGDDIFKNQKLLQASVQANCSTLVGSKYLFKLLVDYTEEKVYLLIRDRNMSFIEKRCYWDFQTLKFRLEQKFKYIALVKAWSNIIDKETYYKFYDIEFYKLKSFENFIKLIEDGTIRVSFKMGVFKKGIKAGQLHDRGISFDIQEIDLLKLFDKIE